MGKVWIHLLRLLIIPSCVIFILRPLLLWMIQAFTCGFVRDITGKINLHGMLMQDLQPAV
jgi:hypothetical protein